MSKKKKNITNWIPLIIILLICLIIGGVLFWMNFTLSGALNQNGYKSPSTTSPFYKKIYSSKNLDEYLTDVKNGINSEYEEYNYTKSSSNLVALKMTYSNGVNKSFNITSDLANNKISFSAEYTYKETRLMVEGNSMNNYTCSVIFKENTDKSTREALCSEAHNEVNIFLNRQNELLNNNIIQREINNLAE